VNRGRAGTAFARALRGVARGVSRRFPAFTQRIAPLGSRRARLYIALTHRASRARGPRLQPPLPADWHPSPSDLAFPSEGDPMVSIVIPVHNQLAFTARCLASIQRAATEVALQVIVVDDASTDGTAAFLAEVRGIEVVRNDPNLGYLRSCNAGSALVRAPFVVLLNNDVEVTDGWVDRLVDRAQREGVGAVGAKLVYPDGALQEAGSIVWSDATGWNYGRGDNPNAFRYEYAREVDYASAACLLVRTDLMSALGGFDERYEPAYYEDTDLAFAIRRRGLTVQYEPRSTIFHFEGVSHGTAVSSGVKRHQVTNRAVFAEKWADDLLRQRRPDRDAVLLARDRRPGPRVVVFDHQVPTPDRDSGSLRMATMLLLLRDLGAVVTLVPANLSRIEPYTEALQREGIEVVYQPAKLDDHLRALAPEVRLCILSRPRVATSFLPRVRKLLPDAALVYDAVDLHFVRERRRAEVEGKARLRRWADRVEQQERDVIASSAATIAITDDEAAAIARLVPGARTFVVPNIHPDVPQTDPSPTGRAGMLFVGSFQHEPNVDAVRYLVDAVMPRIQRVAPDAHLTIAGAHVTAEVEALRRPGVDVLGWVPDLEPLYRSSRLFVAPLRYGAGMKGKVGESMIHGLPVVTTGVGAEGMGAESGRHLIIADDADAFAAAVARLLSDDSLWSTLASEGATLVRTKFGVEAARSRLAELLGALAPPRS
jgi:GT2 family glycosyltransferase